MPRADFAFSHRFRVRYAELDPQGVVFNSRYLEYADLAITEFWGAVGVDAAAGKPFECHVVKALVDYRKPVRFEELDAWVRAARFGTSSLTTLIELHGADRDDLRASIELVHVHVDLASGKAQPIPHAVRRAFDRHAHEDRGGT